MMKFYPSLVLAGLIASVPAASAIAQTKLILDRWIPAAHPLSVGFMEPFKEDVERATQGRVMIEISDSPLAPSAEQWDAVESGISDVAVQSVGWHRQRLRLPTIAHLPFMVPSAGQASVALWQTHLAHFEPANEFEGMQLLGFITHSGTQVANSRRSITSLDDFKGLTVRASAGEPTRIMEMLGGTPVITAGPQIFEYVSGGVVDGILDGMHAPLAFRIIRYVKHVTDIPGSLGGLTFAVFMNGGKWNALSAADRDAIMSVSGETLSRRGGEEFDGFTAKSIAEMKKAGATIDGASPAFMAALEERLQPIINEWIEGAATRNVDGRTAIDYYRSRLSE